MVYLKIHAAGERYSDRFVIAVCDEELIGKEFSEGKFYLKVSERFYKGDKKTDDAVISILQDSTNINLVGKKSIALGIKSGVITDDHVRLIQGVPHAQSASC